MLAPDINKAPFHWTTLLRSNIVTSTTLDYYVAEVGMTIGEWPILVKLQYLVSSWATITKNRSRRGTHYPCLELQPEERGKQLLQCSQEIYLHHVGAKKNLYKSSSTCWLAAHLLCRVHDWVRVMFKMCAISATECYKQTCQLHRANALQRWHNWSAQTERLSFQLYTQSHDAYRTANPASVTPPKIGSLRHTFSHHVLDTLMTVALK